MHSDPAHARFVTDDIPRFWSAFDAAQDAENPQMVFERLYLEPGTPGLQDFRMLRTDQVSLLAAVTAARREFYSSIRTQTLALHARSGLFERVRDIYRAFARLYPPARFPDTTFLIGALGTGGTAAPSGNLIGLEFFSRTPETITHELNTWETANLRSLDDLPFMIAHEYVHVLQQQQGVFEEGAPGKTLTLLRQAIVEGAADFLAALATGEAPQGEHHRYGAAHEAELWARFQQDMCGTDLSGWLYQGFEASDAPADLGYFVGHQIVRAYYRRAADQQRAVAEILRVTDFPAFLAASGYAPA